MPPRDTTPSGRFLLRLPPNVHARLRREAQAAGTSLNDWCVRRLSGDPILAHATNIVGANLLGLVVYGSWARGEAGPDSDVDLLVIVDDQLAVTRDIYRRWDGEPQRMADRVVDAHFVHLGEEVSGTWIEAAIDGILLYDRGHVVARRLAGVRRAIAEGVVSRRIAHGQPYWVTA